MLLSTMKAALAFPILALTSLPLPPFVSTMTSKYAKECTSSRISLCSVIGLLSLLLIFVILILLLFIFSLKVAVVVSSSFFLNVLLVV